MDKIYQKIKKDLKAAGIIVGLTYCVLGSLYGISEHLIGNTTGHVSSDIYLGKHKPTKLEEAIFKPLFKKLNIETKIFNGKK